VWGLPLTPVPSENLVRPVIIEESGGLGLPDSSMTPAFLSALAALRSLFRSRAALQAGVSPGTGEGAENVPRVRVARNVSTVANAASRRKLSRSIWSGQGCRVRRRGAVQDPVGQTQQDLGRCPREQQNESGVQRADCRAATPELHARWPARTKA